MEEFKKILEGIQKSVHGVLRENGTFYSESQCASVKQSPSDRFLPLPSIPIEDEVSPTVSLADRMELKSEPLTPSNPCPVKVQDESELILYKTFTPQKNLYRHALRHQLVVPDLPQTMTKSWLPSAFTQRGQRIRA